MCGSLLLLFFVDQVKHIVDHRVSLYIFADDIKFVKVIDKAEDCEILQRTLDDFHVWSLKMGLRLSASKCGVMRIGKNVLYDYRIGDEVLTRFNSTKDLGIIIDTSLKFSERVAGTVRRTYATG